MVFWTSGPDRAGEIMALRRVAPRKRGAHSTRTCGIVFELGKETTGVRCFRARRARGAVICSSPSTRMVIGHCLARTQADAVQFCLLVDAMVVMLHLWNAMTSHEERDVNFEGSGRGVWAGWGAAIGLAATVTIGRDSDTPNMARYARSALMLATFCFAVDFISSIGGLMSAKHEIDEGLVDVSSWFWPLSFLNVVIWLVITINHLLLAHFSFKQGKEEGSHHSVVPNEVI